MQPADPDILETWRKMAPSALSAAIAMLTERQRATLCGRRGLDPRNPLSRRRRAVRSLSQIGRTIGVRASNVPYYERSAMTRLPALMREVLNRGAD
jgi:DNA-directed RNA polymerase sigma subunit (sigma70/sigma32)